MNTAQGIDEAKVWSQSKTKDSAWYVTTPGKYCVDLTWTAQISGGGSDSVTKTITIVADGDGFEHDADTLTKTCADAADVTDPDPGEGPEPEEPADLSWDVANWTETSSGAKILNLGHVDVASLVSGGKLDTKIKDTSEEGWRHATEHGASWHEPEDVVFQLLPGSRSKVAERQELGFLGEPGSSIWRVNETQDFELLWPGWSTEHIDRGVASDGVEWRLMGAKGPGDFFLYQSSTGSEPIDVLFNTADGVDGADAFTIPERTHAHGSWVFTAEGVYCLAFERSATIGGAAVSDEFTLAVAVGETDPTKVDPDDCAGTGTDPTDPTDPDPTDPDPTDPVPPIGEPVATAVSAKAAKQTYGKTAKLAVSVSKQATGKVRVKVGGKTVTKSLSKGKATVTLPARALKPGSRTVKVSYPGVDGKFKASSKTAKVTVVKASPRVTVKAAKSKVTAGKTAKFTFSVKASGVKPTGKVTVKVAGKSKTVKLGKSGKATVKLTIPKQTKAGKKAVTVKYSGSGYVKAKTAKSKLTVTRR
ncbi:MAG: choice-of-anchor M domain-containing protein [Leucobacter sp.]